MPSKKRTASNSVSAPNTPQKRGRPAAQNGTTSKTHLRAGTATTKRKASAALEDAPTPSQKKSKTSQTPRQQQKQNGTGPSKHTLMPDDYEHKLYTIECPAKQPKKNETQENTFRAKGGESLGLEVDYAIRPGHWGAMKSYRQIRYNGLNFQSGDFAYFAKNLNPPEDFSEEEILASNDPLQYERENYYLGMIAEARADDPKNVQIRILYAYWPEEVPQGRQAYHGMKEVVMSNHMDILDAHTIIGKVDVQQIDDNVDNVDGIYWRQTLDINKFAPGTRKQPGLLSKLKGHCQCGQPINPDKTLYVCRQCKHYNHEECLIDDVLKKAWEKYKAGTLGQDNDEDTLRAEEDDSIEVAPELKKRSPLLSMAANLASKLVGGSPAPTSDGDSAKAESGTSPALSKVPHDDGAAGDTPTKKVWTKNKTQGKERIRKPGDLAPWDGKLRVTIDATGKFGREGVAMAQVVDEKSGEAMWTKPLLCFECEKKLD